MHKKERTSDIIRSLSGLVNYHGLVVGVSDEFHGLFVRGPEGDVFHNFSNYPENIGYRDQKKLKPDFESLSLVTLENKDFLIAFPSMSKPNRDQVGVFHISVTDDQLNIHSQKLFKCSQLLSLLAKNSGELNIEGHLFNLEQMLLLNRGNQKNQNEFIYVDRGQDWLKHVVHHVSDADFEYKISRGFIDLGQYQGHPIHWTEGVWDDECILFLATVEKTDNSYDDGEVLASFIGRYDFKSNKILGLKKILDAKKAEGICRWQSRYLVAIDSDSEEMTNEFYSLPLDVLDRPS